MNFEFGKISIRGKSHIETNMPNQDFIITECIDDTVVVIAADGAGSAKYSEEGAKRVGLNVLNNLKKIKQKSILKDPYSYSYILEKIIIDSIESVRNNLIQGKNEVVSVEAKRFNMSSFFSRANPFKKTILIKEELPSKVDVNQDLSDIDNVTSIKDVEDLEKKIDDYASTFLIMVNSPTSSFTAHIGDGYIIGLNLDSDTNEINSQLVSLPKNGEYENQTYFFTDENWKENLRFHSTKDFLNISLVVTDGADSFWVSKDRQSIHSPLLENFLKIRKKNQNENLTSILEKVFTFEKISSVSTDDASIGMILR